MPDEEAIDWGDGTVWFVSWLDDHDAYHAERWYDPDEFDADDADATARSRDCPGPEEGVFASLDVVEAAMGEPLSADVRARLECEAAANPSSCRHEWGVAFACEGTHLLADGTMVTTWAPAWAEDPLDHKWNLDRCGPAPR